MALSESASIRSQVFRNTRSGSAHAARHELAASLFSVNREGMVLCSTAAAQRDLEPLGIFADAGGGAPLQLAAEWTRRLWAQVRRGATERQLHLLLPGLLPHTGLLMWDPERPDRLTVLLWRQSDGTSSIDPLWHDILTQIGDADALHCGGRAA